MEFIPFHAPVYSQDDRRSDHASTALLRLLLCNGESGGELWINVVKLLRAHGGCLGVRRLRRAWKTAKSAGELSNKR